MFRCNNCPRQLPTALVSTHARIHDICGDRDRGGLEQPLQSQPLGEFACGCSFARAAHGGSFLIRRGCAGFYSVCLFRENYPDAVIYRRAEGLQANIVPDAVAVSPYAKTVSARRRGPSGTKSQRPELNRRLPWPIQPPFLRGDPEMKAQPSAS